MTADCLTLLRAAFFIELFVDRSTYRNNSDFMSGSINSSYTQAAAVRKLARTMLAIVDFLVDIG